ncbi:MAG TPA: hypothetical protein VGM91_08475 [Conexibacter sp.]|jgi:hypothetical protein
MTLQLSRVRRGEWIAGVGAVVLLVTLFGIDWYGASFHVSSELSSVSFSAGANGWHSHTILRWFMLLTIAGGLALWIATATQATDAIPLSLSVVTFDIALVTTVALAWRVLVNEPGPNDVIEVQAGAWIGLAASLAVAVGAWLSLRDEDRRGPELVVPVTRLDAPGRSSAPPPSA